MDFYAIQGLSSHGSFGLYLCRIGCRGDSGSRYCGRSNDTAEHALLRCQFSNEERGLAAQALGGRLDATKLSEALTLKVKGNYVAATDFRRAVMRRRFISSII